MRTWTSAERLLRRELTAGVQRRASEEHVPLAIAVGRRRPRAVIAVAHDQDTDEALAEVAMAAAAFAPTRALVAIAVPHSRRPRAGMAVCCDATWVPDGTVEVTRVWPWYRVGPLLYWPRIELTEWESCSAVLPRVAAAILSGGRSAEGLACLEEVLHLTRAAGHRVRIAR